jgi:hypothetical protein
MLEIVLALIALWLVIALWPIVWRLAVVAGSLFIMLIVWINWQDITNGL